MKIKSKLIVLSFLIVWSMITILAITWGYRFDWPDSVHIDYGVPFTWATQTLSTIVGAVNLWMVDVVALIMDLVFWLGLMLIIISVLLYSFNRKVSKK